MRSMLRASHAQPLPPVGNFGPDILDRRGTGIGAGREGAVEVKDLRCIGTEVR